MVYDSYCEIKLKAYRFLLIMVIICSVGAYMIANMLYRLLTTEPVSAEMVEMHEIMSERYYNEEEGKILLPQAC